MRGEPAALWSQEIAAFRALSAVEGRLEIAGVTLLGSMALGHPEPPPAWSHHRGLLHLFWPDQGDSCEVCRRTYHGGEHYPDRVVRRAAFRRPPQELERHSYRPSRGVGRSADIMSPCTDCGWSLPVDWHYR